MKKMIYMILIVIILTIGTIVVDIIKPIKLEEKDILISEGSTCINTTNIVTTITKKSTKKTTKKTTKINVTIGEYQLYAKEIGKYNDNEMSCLVNLWNKESGWNPNSVNKTSGACGIPQAYPCSKIKSSEGSNDWKAQIRWGIKYINTRYNSPCSAWNHFKQKGWY